MTVIWENRNFQLSSKASQHCSVINALGKRSKSKSQFLRENLEKKEFINLWDTLGMTLILSLDLKISQNDSWSYKALERSMEITEARVLSCGI